MSKTAIYPGSFDPFTNGHMDMVRKAADIFEHFYIVIGVNSNKRRSFPASTMAEAIEETVRANGITNCEVVIWDGLVAEFARLNGAEYMIRGLRNNMDYNYEENVAAVNKLINPELDHDDIAPARKQGRGSCKAETIDFLVDSKVFLDIGVGSR